MPATNASVFQLCQVGLEVTPGTAVAADKLLQAMSLAPRMQGESNEFTPQGQKYPTLEVPNKLWTTAPLTGQPTYTELPYPLACILEESHATVGPVTTWDFITHPGGPDDVKTLTIEYGSDLSARRFTNALCRSFSLNWARNQGISMGGEFFGKQMESGITLTASPDSIPLIPVVSKDINIYLDDTAGAIGTTALDNAFMFSIEISNKFNPKYTLQRANGLTFKTHVEVKPTVTAKLRLEADAAGLDDILARFEVGGKFFIRLEAQSSVEISSGNPHLLTFDMCASVRTPEPFADEEGTYAAEWTLGSLYDGDWGHAFKFQIKTSTADL